MDQKIIDRHNKYAPYWAGAMFLIGVIGISTIYINLGNFWNGYVLDIAGPAWNYILFRGLFTIYSKSKWRQIFNPIVTLIIFLFVCFGIETLQYLEIYDSTYDPYDLLAYVSLLIPLFILDVRQNKKR